MGKTRQFAIDMSMDEIMRAWPDTIAVLLRYRVLCIGCPVATFHTATDAAREHGLDLDEFLRELDDVIANSAPADE